MIQKRSIYLKIVLCVMCCAVLFSSVAVSALNIPGQLKVVLTSNQKGEIEPGTPVTLRASAAGGTRGYLYKFVVGSEGNWTTIKAFGSASTCEWTPTESGDYQVVSYVLDRMGRIASKTLQIPVKGTAAPPLEGTLTSDAGSEIEIGTAVTLSAEASGGTPEYQYRFVSSRGEEWVTLQNFSAEAACVWKPEKAGEYTLTVDIRDSADQVVSKQLTLTVKEPDLPPLEGSFISDQGATVETDTAVTLQAEATGGAEGYEYRFVQEYEGDKLTLQDFSADATYVWTPEAAGSYTLSVDIRDQAGNMISKTLTISVSEPIPPLEASMTADSLTVEVGTKVQFHAKGTGGQPAYQYRFAAESNGDTTVIQQYGAASSCTWTPTKAGSYVVSVDIKDAKGEVDQAQITIVVTEPPVTEQNGSCTGDFVNVRSEPVIQDGNIVTRISTGETFVILKKQGDWYQIRLRTGTVGWIFGEYVKVEDGSTPPATIITLSDTSGTVPAGKTFLVTAKAANGAKLYWESDNPSVATVKDGYILAVAPGTANIIVHDAGYQSKKTCTITVTNADPIRFAYVSPNLVPLNSTANFVAITDQSRTAVQFEVNINGTIKTVDAQKTVEGNTYKWTASLKMTAAGTFSVKAYSKTSTGSYQTCEEGDTSVFVTSSSDLNSTVLERRRVSDAGIQFIADCEGFSSEVYDDILAPGNPTIGYGYVVSTGEQFYNNLTKSEGWALLMDALNNSYYASSVNNFLLNHQVRFNQQQFDALVSFSYNLGSGWQDNSLGDILLSAVGGGSSSGTTITGKVSAGGDGLNVRSAPSTSAAIIGGIGERMTVTLVSKTKYSGGGLSWYQIRLSNGDIGYVCADFIVDVQESSDGTGGQHDLNYVDQSLLISEISAYHHASGNCITGLLTRRFDELDIFLHGEYEREYGVSNRYPLPSCFLSSHPEYR